MKRSCNTDAYLDVTLKDSLGQYNYSGTAEFLKKILKYLDLLILPFRCI